jgi:hypothetical protein
MGYLHPHTTLTLLEGYEQDAVAAAATAAAIATPAALTPAGVYSLQGASSSATSSSISSSSATMVMQAQGLLDRSESGSLTRKAPAAGSRSAPDAAMLRHSWATGGAGSSWRQQQQSTAAAAATAEPPAAPPPSISSIEEQQEGPAAVAIGSLDSMSMDGDGRSSSSSSGDGSSDGGQPVFAGTAATASDWAATAAKAAQLRSVIEWGLEAYGVNAAGSEPSSEVSVVIWPGRLAVKERRGVGEERGGMWRHAVCKLQHNTCCVCVSHTAVTCVNQTPNMGLVWYGWVDVARGSCCGCVCKTLTLSLCVCRWLHRGRASRDYCRADPA